ncbi:hypothetical protein J7T55_001408 [Diaporthe amygdali]|uniref:uncharacterized protein n=1 Tax=Phomopsis amygdali TaxID=1214568 RepID=UPI0022FE89E6|nr:uncharacterized protein J7T55_001408 [Diaporthe amygdali]KAJ0115001.1 hypothetical protein J7T55_001408 [Diaporthe amygdali]
MNSESPDGHYARLSETHHAPIRVRNISLTLMQYPNRRKEHRCVGTECQLNTGTVAIGSTFPIVTRAPEEGEDGTDSSGADVARSVAEYASPVLDITSPATIPRQLYSNTHDEWTET